MFSVSHKRQKCYYAGKYSMTIQPECESNAHFFALISGFIPTVILLESQSTDSTIAPPNNGDFLQRTFHHQSWLLDTRKDTIEK